MITILSRVWQKVVEILHYPAGWLAGFGIFVADAVSGGRLVVYTVIVASVLDLACGIAVSRKRGKFTLSELIRQTVEKLAVYGTVLLAFLCLDKLLAIETTLDITITSGLVGAVITMAEVWSFAAALLILFPKNAFLRLFQKALIGEIARKLQCEEDAVEAILKDARKSKQPRGKNGQFVKKEAKK